MFAFTPMYFGFNVYDALINNGSVGFNTANSDQYGISSTKVNYLGIQGTWKHLVFVMYAGSKTNNKIYGIDNLNNYYSVKLKKDRLKELNKNKNKIIFYKNDICNKNFVKKLFRKHK